MVMACESRTGQFLLIGSESFRVEGDENELFQQFVCSKSSTTGFHGDMGDTVEFVFVGGEFDVNECSRLRVAKPVQEDIRVPGSCGRRPSSHEA